MAGDAPLDCRVLSIGRGVAAAYSLRLLADLGARCAWWQWQQPAPGEWPSSDRFRAYFEHDTNVLRRRCSQDELLGALPAAAGSFDLLIADFTARELAEGELLRLIQPCNPAMVVANADHFGRHGPYARWAGDELTDYALGGYWSLGGDMGRAPLRVPGRQAQFHTGMHLTLAALAAVRHARLSGRGQEVEVAAVEAMLGAHWSSTIAWTHEGRILQRAGSDLFRADDGWVLFFTLFMYPGIFLLIDRLDLMDDPRWTTTDAYVAHRAELWLLVADWCRGKKVGEIVPRGQELRIPVTAVETVESLLADEHLRERDYFRRIDGTAYPGAPFAGDAAGPRRLPTETLEALLRSTPVPVAPASMRITAPEVCAEGPLTGLRVLEVSDNWAGPVAGRHLGDLGAEVIKVELATRPAARSSHYPGTDPGKYHWNRSGYFNQLNRNKRDVCLNLATDRGREIFLELAKWCDVVLENCSSRVMDNLGLSYAVLAQRNPRLVMASISGFGATGPRRDWVAFGSNVEAACGLAAITGYDDETPFRTGSFVADPVAGAHAVIAILAGLERRDRAGEGGHIDISLQESIMPFMLESFTHYADGGQLLRRSGNADPEFAPTGAFRCAGADDWIAIAVRTDAQWASLCHAAHLACDRTLTNVGRLRARDEIDAAIAAWAREQSQFEATRLLQANDVPAAPILHNWQLHADPHFFARASFVPIDHPDTGVMSYQGFPWAFSLTRPRVRMAAPRFAEGNAYVFRHLLGMSDEQVQRLYDAGVTADAPQGMAIIVA